MAANDLLYLIIEPQPDAPHTVSWARVSDLVLAISNGMAATANCITTRRHDPVDPRNRVTSAEAQLGGTVQLGSIIVPLLFEIPQLVPIIASSMTPLMEVPGPVNETLSALADVAAVLELVRAVMVGERGVLARVLDQHPQGPPVTALDRAVDVVSLEFLGQLTQSAISIMEAAERTGAQSVSLQINDQSALTVTRLSPRRSSIALARYGSVANVVSDGSYIIRGGEGVRVGLEGEVRIAFPSPPPAGEPGHVEGVPTVVLWRTDTDLPAMGQRYSVRGRMVPREEVQVLEDLPDDWPDCAGIFLVEKFKPEYDWS